MKKSEKQNKINGFLGWFLMIIGLLVISYHFIIKELYDFLNKISQTKDSVIVLITIIIGISIFFIGLDFKLKSKNN